MTKVKTKYPCVYCHQEAGTRDHIPSRNLYSKTEQVNFITVPSCQSCNVSFGKDEEYFRLITTAMTYEQSPSATELLDNKIATSIGKRPALGVSFFNQMSLVDVYTTEGQYIEKKTGIHMDGSHHQRIFNVLDKYIKGLFFFHFNIPILKEWVLRHHWLTPKFEQKVIHTLNEMRWPRLHQDTVFDYGYNSILETHQSIWCLVFFGQPLFYTFVLDKENAAKWDKRAEEARKRSLWLRRSISTLTPTPFPNSKVLSPQGSFGEIILA